MGAVRQIAVDKINEERSLGISPREALDTETIERYMLVFDNLPPLVLIKVEGEDGLLVADGLHRLRAAKRNKLEALSAEVRKGTVDECIEAAILANLQHGRVWTRREKRNCIDAWLKIHTDRADRWIGEDLTVSTVTVQERRRELEAGVQIERLTKLQGRDGKWYPREQETLGLACGEVYHLDVIEGLRKLKPKSVGLIFADPPYNLGVDYDQTAGDRKSSEEYRDWCWQWLTECGRVLADSGSLYVMQYPEVCASWVPIIEGINLTLRRWISWVYPSNVGQSPNNWTRAHRAILFATKGDDYTFNADADPQPFRNPNDKRIKKLIADGQKGVTPYDWWEYDLVKNVSKQKTNWPNQLPLALLERIIKTSSDQGDIVLDPFMGSGTTAEVATRNKREWLGFDIDPKSAEETAARLEEL